MNIIKYFLFILAACIIIFSALFYVNKKSASSVVPETTLTSTAAKTAEITSTTTATVSTATARPFTILIVPGHDTNSGGAQYKDIYERDLVVTVANKIAELLSSDSAYKVIVARNTEVWNPILQNYFDTNEQNIIDFKNTRQAADKALMSSGQKQFVADMASHTSVDRKTSIELYGVNKWAGENNVDFVMHLHFNDSWRENMNGPGTYSGFTMFIPEHQMVNSSSSRAIARDIYTELKKVFTPEAVGNDRDGLLEDQSLIALGASGTLTKPSVLIEYGYIYDKMLRTLETREISLSKMAEQTVAGIKDYVDSIQVTKNN